MTLDDCQFVTRTLEGDQQAYGSLIDAYQGMVFSVALNITGNYADSEDVVQETFIEAYKKLQTLSDPSRFGSWLYTITRHAALQLLRLRRRLPQSSTQEMLEDLPSSETESPADTYARKELSRLLWQEVAGLPSTSREAILLHYAEGFSVRRASEFLGINEGAFKMRLQYAREKLRDAMMDHVEAELRQHSPTQKSRNSILAALPLASPPPAVLPVPPAAGGLAQFLLAVSTNKLLVAGLLLLIAAPVAYRILPRATPPAHGGAPVPAQVELKQDRHSALAKRARTRTLRATMTSATQPALCSIRGMVRDRRTAVPLSGIRVTARSGAQTLADAVTTQAGAFDIAHLPVGDFTVQVSPADPAAAAGHYFPPDGLATSVHAEEDGVDGLVFDLLPATFIRGHVLDQHDQPVSSAVVCLRLGYMDEIRIPETGSDGAFEAKGLYPANHYGLLCKAPGCTPVTVQRVETSCEKPLTNLIVRLCRDPKASIEGHVLNRQRQPVEGVVVRCDSQGYDGVSTATTSDGSFAFTGLKPGLTPLAIDMDRSNITVNVRPDQAVKDVEILIDRTLEPGFVSGLLVDEANRPITEGQVLVFTTNRQKLLGLTVPDSSGRFKVCNLKQGMHVMISYNGLTGPLGGETNARDVSVPSQDVVAMVHRNSGPKAGLTIRGQVVDKDSGQPIPQFKITACHNDNTVPYKSQSEERVRNCFDKDGLFELSCVDYGPGRNFVYAEAPGYAGTFTPVTTSQGTREAETEVLLGRGCSIEGSVVDSKNRPVQGARMFMRHDEDDCVLSDAQGRFRIGCLRKQSYAFLLATHPDFAPYRSAQLKMDGNTSIRDHVVRLTRGGSIMGAVLDVNGNKAADATVSIHDENQETRFNPRTDKSGIFAAELVPPGNYSVNVWGVREERKQVTVKEGETVYADFGVEGSVVSGNVTLNGKPLPAAIVVISDSPNMPDGNEAKAQGGTDSAGRYSIRNVPPGQFFIKVYEGQRKRLCSIPITITESKDIEKNITIDAGSLSGVVLHRKDGTPAANVQLHLHDDKGLAVGGASFFTSEISMAYDQSDAQGRFRFDTLAAGDYVVQAKLGGMPVDSFARFHVAAGETASEGTLYLEDTGSLAVKTVDAATGAEIQLQGTVIMLNSEKRMTMGHLGSSTPATLPDVPVGEYSVSSILDDADGNKWTCAFQAKITVEAGKEASVVLPVRKSVRVEMTVVDEKGHDVTGFACTAYDTSGAPIAFPMVQLNKVSLTTPAGPMRIVLTRGGKTIHDAVVDVTASAGSEPYRTQIRLAPTQ